MKLIKYPVAIGLMLAASLFSVADENKHICTGEPLPLLQERQLIDAVECIYDAQVIKIELPPALTLQQQQQKNYQGKKIYKVRFLQASGKISNMLVDLYTGLPVDQLQADQLSMLNLEGKE